MGQEAIKVGKAEKANADNSAKSLANVGLTNEKEQDDLKTTQHLWKKLKKT